MSKPNYPVLSDPQVNTTPHMSYLEIPPISFPKIYEYEPKRKFFLSLAEAGILPND